MLYLLSEKFENVIEIKERRKSSDEKIVGVWGFSLLPSDDGRLLARLLRG